MQAASGADHPMETRSEFMVKFAVAWRINDYCFSPNGCVMAGRRIEPEILRSASTAAMLRPIRCSLGSSIRQFCCISTMIAGLQTTRKLIVGRLPTSPFRTPKVPFINCLPCESPDLTSREKILEGPRRRPPESVEGFAELSAIPPQPEPDESDGTRREIQWELTW